MGGRQNCSLVISVDPGKDAGIALWKRGRLHWAGLARGTWHEAAKVASVKIQTRINSGLFDAKLVAEVPQFYGTGGKRANDLLGLPLMVGALTGYLRLECESVETLFPKEWKGQVPKNVMVKRVLKKLERGEKEVIDKVAKTLQHNIYDAIGIGLHWHGRLR